MKVYKLAKKKYTPPTPTPPNFFLKIDADLKKIKN